ncbi:MAG TPA: tRNA (adenosine(37)-N6)-threonylcarbamoyltransferase complex dimerization subunit type 1 TsaB [Acidimicrobiales bacterium]|nr:tRNA (adenosine(37)-N6)-threonylcarbamoyltransferase complex dimerization subunit type 1 TsaB [Acidimicrobiales bacterium]
MRVLGIETATPCAGCALWDEGGPVASFMLTGRQRHAEVLMPAIDDLCRGAGWSVGDLTGVVVDRGPGLFTGLRVGLATARAIAMARGIPAAGVTSLEALAYPHRRRAGLLAPIVDARRGQVFWALYETGGPSVKERRPPAVAEPEKLAGVLAALGGELAGLGGTVLAVGDGAWRYREELVAAGVEVGGVGEMWPSALAVAELGWLRLLESPAPERPVSVDLAPGGSRGGRRLPEPLYLRPADVRIGWEEVGGRVGGPRPPPDQTPEPAGQPRRPAGQRTPAGASGGGAAASAPEAPKLAP